MVQLVAGSAEARSALALPRERWQEHPHFATQALLLGSHQHFRDVGDQLIRWARGGVAGVTLRRVFGAWKGGMHSHEGYEEYKLYPFLRRRWNLDLQPCEEGHSALGRAEAAVFACLAEDGPADAATIAALEHHQEVLLAHLELEESVVLPALLALTPEEFDAYARQ